MVIPAAETERAARYRSLLAGRRVLVVLDNAASVEQVRALLPGTPSCAVMVTSRDSLAGLVARDGARRLDLDLLPLAEAVSLLRELIGQRVDADPGAAEALAARCSRLPLALRVAAELAVARPAFPLPGLVHELGDQQRRLDFLAAGGDSRTAVRAVFAWSYRHLEPAAARVFRLVALHPGLDLDVYAAAALTAATAERARDMLDVLARGYLLQPAALDRYSMHDLLRAYARELAAARETGAERRAALARLFDYYLSTAATAVDALSPADRHRRPRLEPPATPAPLLADPAAARAWLDAQRATLVVAAGYLADNGWPGHATRLSATLSGYLATVGHLPEAITIHSNAVSVAHRTGDLSAEAEALAGLGSVDFWQGRCQEAAARFQRALALHREAGDRLGEAWVLSDLGILGLQQGRYQEASDQLRQALELHRKAGDRYGEGRNLGNLGRIEQRQGRYQQAARYHQQALAMFSEIGDRNGEGYTLARLGDLDLRQGSYDHAAGRFEQSLARFRETGNRTGESGSLSGLGQACLRLGCYQRATGYLRQALTLFREFGALADEAEALNSLGEVLLATGHPGEARAEHAAALRLACQVGVKYEQAGAHRGLSRTYYVTGEAGQAFYHWRQAITLYTDLGAPEADELRAQLADVTTQHQRQH